MGPVLTQAYFCPVFDPDIFDPTQWDSLDPKGKKLKNLGFLWGNFPDPEVAHPTPSNKKWPDLLYTKKVSPVPITSSIQRGDERPWSDPGILLACIFYGATPSLILVFLNPTRRYSFLPRRIKIKNEARVKNFGPKPRSMINIECERSKSAGNTVLKHN